MTLIFDSRPSGEYPEDDDPFIDGMRRAWRDGAFDGRPLDEDLFTLSGDVGRYKPNDRHDLAKVQVLLDQAGAYDLTPTDGPTGYYGRSQEDAILDYQRQNSLTIDGWLYPDGETIRNLGSQLNAPQTLDEVAAEESGLPTRHPEQETQVAFVPALAAAAPYVLPAATAAAGVAARVLPRLLGAGAAITAAKVASDAVNSNKNAESQPLAGSPSPRDANKGPPPVASKPDWQERLEALDDDVVRDLMRPVYSHPGNKWTKHGNKMLAQECRVVLDNEFPEFKERLKHVAGATLPEKAVWNKEKTVKKFPDYTLELDDDPTKRAHANTVTTNADKVTPDARERRILAELRDIVGKALAIAVPKFRKGDDEDKYRDMARGKCREIIRNAIEAYDDRKGNPDPAAE